MTIAVKEKSSVREALRWPFPPGVKGGDSAQWRSYWFPVVRSVTTETGRSYVIGQQGNIDGEYWAGDIAEIMVYNRQLSAEELRRLETCLRKSIPCLFQGRDLFGIPVQSCLACFGLSRPSQYQRISVC